MFEKNQQYSKSSDENAYQPEYKEEHASGDCLAACPVDDNGSVCLRTCVLTQGHYGSHKCSQGHTWS